MLTSLKRIIHEMDLTTDLLSALSLIARQVCEELNITAAAIFLLDEARAEYILLGAAGLSKKKVANFRIKLGEGAIGLVGEREEPINLADASGYSDFIGLAGKKFFGFLGIPILYQGHLLGVLAVMQPAKNQFALETSGVLTTLAIQLAADIAEGCAKGGLQRAIQSKTRKIKELQGIPGSPGVAMGKGVLVFLPTDLNAVPEWTTTNIKKERALFEQALTSVRAEIAQLQVRAQTLLSVAEQALFDAYLRILDSRTLMNEIIEEIEAGQWAQGALKKVIKRHILHFESLEDNYLRERAADFKDLGRRILAHLQTEKPKPPGYPKKTILISEEVTATSILEAPRERLAGIISASGSANSHVAILARSLGVPAVMGLTGAAMEELSQKELIVDGYNGQVHVAPGPAIKKEFKTLIIEEHQLNAELEQLKNLPAKTKDGHAVALMVNLGLTREAEEFDLVSIAQGVGLYRTELTFMARDHFPSEAEQLQIYKDILKFFHPASVVMRTLDIGGDKELAYFPVQESNPFLGWRGIRVSLDHPEIFLQQIRAMLSANTGYGNLSILLPMISSVWEIEQSMFLIKQAYYELLKEQDAVPMPKIGVMVEVPSAVYQAFEMAKRVDFLSVGSNDLIQYILAVDRNNPQVAASYNGFHPAVLRALQQAVTGAHKAGKPITICGELAGDPLMVILLLAMGFDALSMNAPSLLRIKWVIRQFTLKRAQDILKQVLKMDDAVEIRNHLEMILEEHDLAGLIRAGRR
ncbi:MAG: phosphoenolpyruvate--protein phosphotransferase [Proteobacteria bacterium]|nr:phosphoenolpyruvate--protein phosphotransferase [Pseudomonadota bacterium]